MTDNIHDNISTYFKLRRCILETLYKNFMEVPYASVEFNQLLEDCGVDDKDLNWNLVYLEKSGLIELRRADSYLQVALSVALTANGIDLVEDRKALNNKFPSGCIIKETKIQRRIDVIY